MPMNVYRIGCGVAHAAGSAEKAQHAQHIGMHRILLMDTQDLDAALSELRDAAPGWVAQSCEQRWVPAQSR